MTQPTTDDDRMNRWCAAGTLIAFLAAPVAVVAIPALAASAFCFWRAWRYVR